MLGRALHARCGDVESYAAAGGILIQEAVQIVAGARAAVRNHLIRCDDKGLQAVEDRLEDAGALDPFTGHDHLRGIRGEAGARSGHEVDITLPGRIEAVVGGA